LRVAGASAAFAVEVKMLIDMRAQSVSKTARTGLRGFMRGFSFVRLRG